MPAQTSSSRGACSVLRLLLLGSAAVCLCAAEWLDFGAAIPNLNHRKQSNTRINSDTVQGLQNLFTVNVGIDVSATPAVYRGVVYFPDWSGYLWAIDSNTGATIWKKQIKSLLPSSARPGPGVIVSRNTPAIDPTHNMMVFGTLSANQSQAGRHAFVMAVSLTDGKLAWVNTESANYHPYNALTGSMSVYDGAVYVGVSSFEEEATVVPGFKCCGFRGSLIKLHLDTGAHVWQTFTAPPPPENNPTGGFSGVSVWGSAPTIDMKRQLVYVGTGNNYKVPDNIVQCLNDPKKTIPEKAACEAVPGNWYDSILAVSMNTGEIVWGSRRSFFDVWTLACRVGLEGACPVKESRDYDFAQHPLYFPDLSCPGKKKTDLLVASAKSGLTFGLDINTFRRGNAPTDFWPPADTGVGGFGGGAQWGSATDGKTTVFVPNTNSVAQPHVLINPAPNSVKNTTAGFMTAIDLCTGKIKWQAAAPNGAILYAPPTFIGHDLEDGVVVIPSMTTVNTTTGAALYFFQASTGQLLLQLPLNNNSGCGPAVSGDTVYLGDGYTHFRIGKPGNTFYAFRLPSSVGSPPCNTSPSPSKASSHMPSYGYSG